MENVELFAGAAGLFFIAFYFFRYKKSKEYQKNGISTNGVVIDVLLEYNHSQDRYYYPIVRFALADGTWFTSKYSDGTYPASFAKGEKVRLLYKEDDPESYIIVGDKNKHADRLFLVIGALLCAYSLFSLMQ